MNELVELYQLYQEYDKLTKEIIIMKLTPEGSGWVVAEGWDFGETRIVELDWDTFEGGIEQFKREIARFKNG